MVGRPTPPSLIHHIAAQVQPEGDCLLWTGTTTKAGDNPHARPYGQMTYAQNHFRVHRVVYEYANGPIPPGMVVDHVCRQTLCLNPFHMEAVSNVENLRRGLEARGFARRDT